ncbi:hypothetical protein IHE44_0007277 [Lamprotornis superbus]|uniref:Uncharacterized protein n=1 Tax=Lamprotornis superbus TaxID=245042 RepID=A0A835NV07_9PASS|nr:hypothetical protein IHE44_0007277 [Lamprotornis superbus]
MLLRTQSCKTRLIPEAEVGVSEAEERWAVFAEGFVPVVSPGASGRTAPSPSPPTGRASTTASSRSCATAASSRWPLTPACWTSWAG